MLPNVSRKPVLDRILGVFLLAMAALLALPALAQTTVSGSIGANTRWSIAGAPYVVSGNVSVENNAVLSIDPGVTVFMSAGTSLTVMAGSIQAAGTSANRIRVLSDKTRQGSAAAPGDWQNWLFTAGTRDTRLDHVDFEHGSGLQVRGSAPVFNNLAVRNHLGAAISVDLTASPSGVGNEATGNTLNGIEVPAGEIRSTVNWGLRGIPYVVAAGTVSIGVPPTVSSVSPTTLQQGENTTVTVSGTRLAGLAGARFDKPGLTAEVLAGGTDTQASLTVRAEAGAPVGSTALTVVADAGEATLANALNLIQSQPVLVGIAPATLYAGQGPVAVTLSGRNFSAQSIVLVNGTPAATQVMTNTQVIASIPDQPLASNLSIVVRTPDPLDPGQYLVSNTLLLPVQPAQMVVTPSTATIPNGLNQSFSVTLPYAAPVGGLVINLVSSVPAVASVPASVSIPQGATSTSFELTATGLGNTVITASKTGFVSGQTQITVVVPPSLTITPNQMTLGVGRQSEITIQSSKPAPDGGLIVGVASSNAGVVTAPASVVIPAGSSFVKAVLSTVAIGNATVQASAEGFVSGAAVVTVRPISLNLPGGALVSPGLSRSIPLVLSDPAPVGGLIVSLVSSDPATATVLSSITVPAGQTSANFTLNGIAAGSATISASADGYQSANMPTTVAAVAISLGTSSISIPVDITSSSYAVTLSRPAPIGGVVINLAMSDPTRATVSPSSITIPEGQTSGGVVRYAVTGVATGSATLVASAPGMNSANATISVTGKPALLFSTTAVTVGKGLNTYYQEVHLRRTTSGNGYYGDAVTVNLTSSDASKVRVPATVTIPAGQYYTYFTVTGVDVTGGTPAMIDAEAVGYTKPATKLSANVANPTITIYSLDGNRSTESGRDNFYVSLATPGASYSGSQPAVADIAIDLSIVNAAPAGLIPGFHNAATGGTAITQAVVKAGSTNSSSSYSYVDTPTAGGTYQVRAGIAGGSSAASAVQTVSAPDLRFSSNTVTVGKGLNTYYQEIYVYRTVNGTNLYGTSAVTVNLTCSSTVVCVVPPSVTIPAGQYMTYFTVTGKSIGSTTVSASAIGYSATQDIGVNVVASRLNFSGPSSTTVGRTSNFSVYLNAPGANYSGSQPAASAMTVSLTSSVPGVATVPATVTISAGSTYSSTAVMTGVAAGTTTLTASSADLPPVTSGAITINP